MIVIIGLVVVIIGLITALVYMKNKDRTKVASKDDNEVQMGFPTAPPNPSFSNNSNPQHTPFKDDPHSVSGTAYPPLDSNEKMNQHE